MRRRCWSSWRRKTPTEINIAGSDLLYFGSIMMKRETIAIADIYVPIKRRATLEQKRVDEIAASILDKGLQSPILVRVDGAFIRKSSKRVHMAAAAPRG